MGREVPYVEGRCDECGQPGWVLDFYGDYICPSCVAKHIPDEAEDTSEEPDP